MLTLLSHSRDASTRGLRRAATLRTLADALARNLHARLHRLPRHGHLRAHLGRIALRRLEGERADIRSEVLDAIASHDVRIATKP